MPIDVSVPLNAVALVAFISHQELSRERERAREEGGGSFWKLAVYSLFGFQRRQPSCCLRHESLDTVQVRPTWQEGELHREAEFISCSCESYISTIPLCAVWQRRNDGCHLSYGLKEAVGKGI